MRNSFKNLILNILKKKVGIEKQNQRLKSFSLVLVPFVDDFDHVRGPLVQLDFPIGNGGQRHNDQVGAVHFLHFHQIGDQGHLN